MKTYKYLYILLLLLFASCAEENLTCEDFKEGIFYAYYDQLPEEKENVITRKNNRQVEKSKENIIYVKLDWIDDCSYTAKFDELKTNKKTLNFAKKLNDNQGVVVTKVAIKGRCFYDNATLTNKEGQESVSTGRICKQ